MPACLLVTVSVVRSMKGQQSSSNLGTSGKVGLLRTWYTLHSSRTFKGFQKPFKGALYHQMRPTTFQGGNHGLEAQPSLSTRVTTCLPYVSPSGFGSFHRWLCLRFRLLVSSKRLEQRTSQVWDSTRHHGWLLYHFMVLLGGRKRGKVGETNKQTNTHVEGWSVYSCLPKTSEELSSLELECVISP